MGQSNNNRTLLGLRLLKEWLIHCESICRAGGTTRRVATAARRQSTTTTTSAGSSRLLPSLLSVPGPRFTAAHVRPAWVDEDAQGGTKRPQRNPYGHDDVELQHSERMVDGEKVHRENHERGIRVHTRRPPQTAALGAQRLQRRPTRDHLSPWNPG